MGLEGEGSGGEGEGSGKKGGGKWGLGTPPFHPLIYDNKKWWIISLDVGPK